MGRPRTWTDETKVCEECGGEFARSSLPRRIATSKWATRRYCSRGCRDLAASRTTGEANRNWRGGKAATRERRLATYVPTGRSPGRPATVPVDATKECERCGETFSRQQPTYLISAADWKKRRFCSDPCRNAWMGETSARLADEGNHPAATDSDDPNKGRRQAVRLFSLEDKECVVCGAKATVRHHHDENTLNNAPENIVPMCRPHHAKLHAEKITAARLASEKWWASVRRPHGS